MTAKQVTPNTYSIFFSFSSETHFDNFTLRIPSNFMSGVFEIIKPIKLTCSFRLSAFLDAPCSVSIIYSKFSGFFFSILSFINIICWIETHPILFKTWNQNKQHHLELLITLTNTFPKSKKTTFHSVLPRPSTQLWPTAVNTPLNWVKDKYIATCMTKG